MTNYRRDRMSNDGFRASTHPTASVELASKKAEREAERPQCFPTDTYVMTKGGMVVEIDRIGVGTLVLSRCEKTGEQAYKRVTKKFVHSRENWDAPLLPTYKIKIVTAEGKRDGLEATPEHPFWVNGIGWVPAHELQPGQMLEICDPLGTDDCDRPVGQKTEDMILSGQRWQAEVVSVEQDTGSAIVYNIEVEDFHTYFVGVFGVWVHNKNQGEPAFTQELKMSDENAVAKGEKNRRKETGDSPENNNAARGENESVDMLSKYDGLEFIQQA